MEEGDGMTRMTGGSASVERKIGRAISCPNGDNERPYGRCYGQVCGVSYPCTQREYIDPKKEELEERKAANKAAKKAEYMKAKKSQKPPHNESKRVRCIDTGAVYPSICAAANAIGMKQSTLSWQLREHGTAVHNGRSYEFDGVR